MKRLYYVCFRLYVSYIIIKLAIVGICLCQKVSFNELQSLNASCSPLDTCSKTRIPSEDNLLSQTCECRPSCVKYNTCCIDVPQYTAFKRKTASHLQINQQHECFYLDTDLSFYAQTKCADKWQGDPLVKDLCENATRSLKDPLTILPVTNPVTATTYKNYFCALCNNGIRNLEFWNVNIIKSNWRGYSSADDDGNDPNKVLQSLAYNEEYQEWGTYTKRQLSYDSLAGEKDSNKSSEFEDVFESVKVSFRPSDNQWPKVTRCDPYLISDCDTEWTDDVVRNKCHSYMAMIYANANSSSYERNRYKNIHCAICNFAGEDPGCKQMIGVGYAATTRPSLNFALLLDVNTSDGSKVGAVEKCNSNEIYDPFFKKCRSMICKKPGHKIKNGQCRES